MVVVILHKEKKYSVAEFAKREIQSHIDFFTPAQDILQYAIFLSALLFFVIMAPPFTEEQRTTIIRLWYQTYSVTDTRQMFSVDFPNRSLSASSVRYIIKQFERGKFNCGYKNSGRKIHIRTPVVIGKVRELLANGTATSVRTIQRSIDVAVSKSTIHSILRKDLGLFPYKVTLHQPLTRISKNKRLNFAVAALNAIQSGLPWHEQCFFADEAHFYLNYPVNIQNDRQWDDPDTHNSQIYHSVTKHQQLKGKKVTIYIAIHKKLGIFGPYYFEKDNGEAITINSENYRNIFLQHFIPEALTRMMENHMNMKDQYYMHDNARSHTAMATSEELQKKNVHYHNHYHYHHHYYHEN